MGRRTDGSVRASAPLRRVEFRTYDVAFVGEPAKIQMARLDFLSSSVEPAVKKAQRQTTQKTQLFRLQGKIK
jgi:hypothetical protein